MGTQADSVAGRGRGRSRLPAEEGGKDPKSLDVGLDLRTLGSWPEPKAEALTN